jgi:predicted Zn-dependent peptidase
MTGPDRRWWGLVAVAIALLLVAWGTMPGDPGGTPGVFPSPPAPGEPAGAAPDAPIPGVPALSDSLPRPFRGDERVLRNGLKVILVEDHGAPTIAARVAFRVGSADDPAGSAGLAHFVEHLIFSGTARLGTANWREEAPALALVRDLTAALAEERDPEVRTELLAELAEAHAEADVPALPGELHHLLDELGARNVNALTSVDRTSFQALLPSNALEPWAVAMAEALAHPVFRGFLLERDVVDEERRLRDRCAGGWSALQGTLFAGHPYASPIAGTPESLAAMDFDAVEQFHQRWYTPDNAAVVLVGDFDAAAARETIERTFGNWFTASAPRRGPPRPIAPPAGDHLLPGGEPTHVQVAWPLRMLEPGDLEALRVFALFAEHAIHGDTRDRRNQASIDVGVLPFRAGGLLYAEGWCSEPVRCDQAVREVMRGGADLVRPEHIAWAANHAWVAELRRTESHDDQAAEIVDGWSRGEGLDALWLQSLRTRQLTPERIREVVSRVLVVDTSAGMAGAAMGAPKENKPKRHRSPYRSEVDEDEISAFYAEVLGIPVADLPPAWRTRGVDWTEALDGRVIAVPNPSNTLFQADLSWRRGWREEPALCAALDAWLYDALQPDGEGWGRALGTAGVSIHDFDCAWDHVNLRIEGPGEYGPLAIARVQAALLAPQISAERRHSFRALWQRTDHWRELLHGPLRFVSAAELDEMSAAEKSAAIRTFARTPPDLRYTGPHTASDLAPFLYGAERGEPDLLPPILAIDAPTLERRAGDPSVAAVRVSEPFDPGREGLYRLYDKWLAGRTGIVSERVRDGHGAAYSVRADYFRGRWPGEANYTVVTLQTEAPAPMATVIQEALAETRLGKRWERVAATTGEQAWTGHVDFRELPGRLAAGFDRGFPGDPQESAWDQLATIDGEDFAAFLTAEAARPLRIRVTTPGAK